MATDIDSLQIKIKGTAQGATKSINTLIKNLDNLQSHIQKIDTSKFKNFSINTINLSNSTKKLSGSLNTLSASAKSSTKTFGGLASTFGKFYANFFWVIRGLKGIRDAIDSTADYVEAFNYYTVSFGKVASKWDSEWTKYADENAKNYANEFVTTLNDSFKKLSGVSFDPQTGLLSSTGLKNLGLNLQEVTQYAAQLASMMDAVGQSGKTTLATTNAFVKLAGDISSLYNIDYSEAGSAIRSVLQGQSRAGYKFGWDTTMASLQSTADKLDLSKAVSEMTQMEKQQLRILTILEQSRVAWGDQSNTINTLANQMRMFKNNMAEAGMLLGQLFVPLMQKLMPIINGVTIAIKDMLSSFAMLFGIKIEDTGQGFTETEDNIDGVTDSLDGATESAKALKKSLRGFDKLNLITTTKANENGSGNTVDLTEQILSATQKYEEAWKQAYENMESKAEAFAKRVSSALEPIKKIFQDFAIGDYFQAGQDISNLVVSLNEFLARAIQNVDWDKVGTDIGNFLSGIEWGKILSSFGTLFWEAINASIEQWKGTFDAAPIETTILTALVGLPLLSQATKWIYPLITFLTGLFAEGGLFGAGGLIASASAPILAVAGALTVLGAGLGVVYAKNEEVRDSFSNAVSVIGENLKPLLEVFTDEILPDLKSGWNELLNIFQPLGEFLNTVFVSIWQDMLNPTLEYLGSTVLPILTETLNDLWNNIFVPFGEFIGNVLTPVIDILSQGLTLLWENVVVPLAGAVGNILGKAFEGIARIFNDVVVPGVKAIIDIFDFLWEWVLEPLVNYAVDKLSPVFEEVFKTIGDVIDGLGVTFGGLIEFITGVFAGDWEAAWNGIVDVFKGIFNGIGSVVEGVINFVIGGLNDFLEPFNGIVTTVGDVVGLKISIPKIPKVDIPKFETGGFPEDGLFFANHNELVGQFSNGKTAVANNEQIIKGIANGVRDANEEQNALLREQNALLRQILAKDTGISSRDVFNAVRSESSNYKRRTGQPAFI